MVAREGIEITETEKVTVVASVYLVNIVQKKKGYYAVASSLGLVGFGLSDPVVERSWDLDPVVERGKYNDRLEISVRMKNQIH